MKLRSLALGLLLVSALTVACGGDDAKDDAAVSSVTPGGPTLTDTQYLAVFCSGVTSYREALLTEPREGLLKVVRQYYDSMAAIVPPPDVASFHKEFLSYLKDALEEPTYLVTRNPPVPDDSVRSRLAATVSSVPECKYPTFLEGQ